MADQRKSGDQDTAPGESSEATISSRNLLGEGRRLTIDHNGEIYRLSLTRHGKLILTK